MARLITDYGSTGAGILPLARFNDQAGRVHVAFIYLEAGGLFGRHPSVGEQLLLLIEGTAEVSGDNGEATSIAAGYGAYWHAGEWHETRTATGLVAFVIEAGQLDPRLWGEGEQVPYGA